MSYYGKYLDYDYNNTNKCPHNINAPYALWELINADVLVPYPLYRLELLSPATATTYKIAVQSGADAIYFGYGNFNARANADNLTDFEEIVAFCHRYGAKAYLALNIMLKDNELTEVKRVIAKAEKAKIDAFIISDLALLPIIRRISQAAVHASTQMGIHNVAGAEFCYNLGIDRIVLSREVSRQDIFNIMVDVDIESEMFGHGALCTGFSGACLLSSMLTGKSGNRGRCLQLCRKKYSCYINGEKIDEGFLLSSKDICMAPQLNVFEKYVVNSFKIEGRLKNERYIEGVTAIYNALRSGEYAEDDESVVDRLKAYFNRGDFTCGYWDNNDVIYKKAPNHIGVFYGKISKVISKNLVTVKAKGEVNKGDCFRVIRRGNEVGGIVATGEVKVIQEDEEDYEYVCYAPCQAMAGDNIFLTKIDGEYDEPRKNIIKASVRIVGGERAHVIAECREEVFEYIGEPVPKAINAPITQHDVIMQFIRTCDTDYEFYLYNLIVENAFMTKKMLNDVRRAVIGHFDSAFIEHYERPAKKKCPKFEEKEKIDGDFVELDSITQLTDTILTRFKNIVFSPKIYTLRDSKDFYRAAKNTENRIFILLPIFINTENEPFAKKIINIFDGVVANNPGAYQMALEAKKLVVAGWNLNVANTSNYFWKASDQTVVSTELTKEELKNFPDSLVYTYGRLTLMYLNFCPKRSACVDCDRCHDIKTIAYRDDKGEYPIITKRINDSCLHELKNSVITNLGALKEGHFGYFDFTGMKVNEINSVLKKYYSDKSADTSKFNHLHLNRGVE